MGIKRYGWDDLRKARRLQAEALKLHLPCPPVAWWDAKVSDADGKLKEHIQGKCNSYVRNGLNLIASHSMFMNGEGRSTSVFADGSISYKNTSGTFNSTSAYWYGYSSTPYMHLGTDDTAVTLNDINLGAQVGAGWTLGSVAQIISFADSKLLHNMTRAFTNATGSSVSLKESGLIVAIQCVGSTSYQLNPVLVIRDVFAAPIVVANTERIIFEYNFELLYSV